jgi:hypothetical protein
MDFRIGLELYAIKLVNEVREFKDDIGYSIPDGQHLVLATISTVVAGQETIMSFVIEYAGQFRIYNMGEESPYKD